MRRLPRDGQTGSNLLWMAGRSALWIGLLILVMSAQAWSPMAAGALLVAAGAIAAWFAGEKWASGLVMICLVANLLNSENPTWPNLGANAVVVGISMGLLLWIAGLRRALKAEHHRARTDSLTGLPNRRDFQERFAAELSRAKRFDRPVTLAMLDGDQFKAVNDRHGHAAGDRALQTTGSILSETMRRYDTAARLGGDEFAILLPETNPVDAAIVVQRLQQAVTDRLQPAFPPLTYSIGIATFYPGDWEVESCLAAADRVLYAAKKSGPNAVRQETFDAATEPSRR